jgi:DNA-binding Xre family transcriptional regulator
MSLMANREKNMDLTQIVARNLQRLCREHDLSSRELAARADMPQKTAYNTIQGNTSCQLPTLEKICKTLLVSPTAMVTPHLPTNILMSRRVPRILDKYAKLTMDQRDTIEDIMDKMLDIEQPVLD